MSIPVVPSACDEDRQKRRPNTTADRGGSLRKAANNPVTLSCGREHISKRVNKAAVWRSLENFATTPPCKSLSLVTAEYDFCIVQFGYC